MTQTPRVLTETPSGSNDPLSDVLASMHLAGAVLFRADFREPWSVATPDCRQLARLLTARSEHLIPFHVVAAGSCCLAVDANESVWLRAGDAVLLPYGDSHSLQGSAAAETVPVGRLLPPPPWNDIPLVQHGGAGDETVLVCGFVQCDELLFHPILHHLPRVLHACPSADDDLWLANTIRHTAAETGRPRPGSRALLARLTELMFVEMLRKHMQELAADEIGWFAAYRDPVAGTALACLHADPLRNWSVDDLARTVGTSRTVLAERFHHFLDQPPMQYLANWRLQLAAQQLKSSRLPIKNVAERAGYDSEAAFSRAFKRRFGAAPGAWRQRQAQA